MKLVQRFQVAIRLAIVGTLAWLWPEIGLRLQQFVPADKLAIAVIFLLTGLVVSAGQLRQSAENLRLHVYLQAMSFVVFPLLVLATRGPLSGLHEGQITAGLFALAAVPTTVSTCVVFTTLAHGNASLAIFNSVLGNLLGLFLSPLIFQLLARTGGVSSAVDYWGFLRQLTLQVIVPLLIGQLAPGVIKGYFRSRRKLVSGVNGYGILLIVYVSFCRAFSRGAGGLQLTELLQVFVYAVLLHAAILGIIAATAPLLTPVREDRIALLFVGSQKTMALGLPLVLAFCEHSAGLNAGIVLVPMIVYHPLQLIVASFISSWLSSHASAGGGAVADRS